MGFRIPAKCEHCRYREGIECTYGSPICPVSVQTQTSMTIDIEKVMKWLEMCRDNIIAELTIAAGGGTE